MRGWSGASKYRLPVNELGWSWRFWIPRRIHSHYNAAMDASAIRLIGCRNCRAAISIQARFCPRCGMATAVAPAPVALTAEPVIETSSQRHLRLENEVDALADYFYSGQTTVGIYMALAIVGGLCALAGLPVALTVLILVLAGIVFGLDVRRHVKAREAAERRVRAKH